MTRLKSLFPRPEENEEIPIQLIDMQQKLAGWSPKLRRSVYVDDFKDTEDLKRVRDVTLLRVYNWFLDGESLIELSEMEKAQFESIMDMFIKHGGEIRYTRKKVGGRLANYFRLETGRESEKEMEARSLSDIL
ncbi:hypothetical protein [Methanolobus chelungpuianus]|uniref:Uncharacterized protein n=1 Tax=Methanolobus chelungpuianus TaxID=502115 RepID=A0AAE3HBW0_9EURY|nr:hypothetical protein [Methanolobus chelungpuianus]MCQ6963258.1 hypothetical protein [Methanolobus chelungpuianus]